MKVVSFGEIMLRLSPARNLKFIQADSFEATYGGGEANVSLSLANYGIDSAFVTKLPNNDIGQSALNKLRQFGVDTSKIVRGGNRLGIYYCEKGASQRPSKVIYDRANSAIAEATVEDFDFNAIFEGVNWFHFTGITPALSDNVAEITKQALIEAKKRNITVSCDINYRKKLWTREKANTVMSDLMQYVDVAILNEEDAFDVFKIKPINSDVNQGSIDNDEYKSIAKQLYDKFNFKFVAITLRQSLSASDNLWNALLFDGKDSYLSNEYKMHIVDRVGGGDSFAGGLIYGMLNNFDNQKTIDFAVGASCLKHTIEGDFNHVSVDDVLNLINGDGSGRVQR